MPGIQFPYLAAMLRFDSLSLTQFKNYPAATFHFTGRIVGICGPNGIGKTNLLDALYYCCFTKSYFSSSDALAASQPVGNQPGFRLQAQTSLALQGAAQAFDMVCIWRGTNKKEFTVNGAEYDRLSQHIGRFPCVMVAPDDVELITGSGSERRRLLDLVLGQTDADYLQQLIVYNKVLQQRNSLLKRFAEQGHTDLTLLEVLDSQLAPPGQYIYQQRLQLATALLQQVQQRYAAIASTSAETISLRYESQLHQADGRELLVANRSKDLALQRTCAGIHKDDIAFELNGLPFKNIASQGQRKSLLFALKLAEFELLRQNKGFAPILLLDDVFEKLDEQRMLHLLHHVCVQNEGQVFITDTHRERLEAALTATGQVFQLVELGMGY
jgi:DNA replication and repair protein RecF